MSELYRDFIDRKTNDIINILDGVITPTATAELYRDFLNRKFNDVIAGIGSYIPPVSFPTVSGSIVTFNSQYAGLPLKSCTSLISGYQEGSGTPSPSNPRTLHPFSSGTLTANSDAYTITFGQNIYSGSIDWLKGVVTASQLAIDLGSLTWTYDAEYSRFISSAIDNIRLRGTRRLGFNCEIYQVISDGRPLANVPDYSIYTGVTDNITYLYIHDSTFSGDVSALTTYLTGKYVALPLQNSITIPLGGIQPLTQEGQNNIWADTGNTTLQYIKIGGNT